MRLTFHKPIVYCYTLASTIAKAGFASKRNRETNVWTIAPAVGIKKIL